MLRNFSVSPIKYLKLGHDTFILEHLPFVLPLRATEFDSNSVFKWNKSEKEIYFL
jgi:hypothetical protein